MQDHENTNPDLSDEDARRRDRLLKNSVTGNKKHTKGYTVFIRRMRLFLPLLAVVILVALMTWPQSSETITATEEEKEERYKNVQKNELLNPKFESVDEKNQPYTVTADKAVQSDDDKDLLILTNPLGDIVLNSNNRITVEAREGFFRQEAQKLRLKEAVRLTHDEGYDMRMAELYVDMNAKTAHSETPVEGTGPQGTLSAQGLKANQQTNHIIFTGPAKLVLNDVSFMEGLSPPTAPEDEQGG